MSTSNPSPFNRRLYLRIAVTALVIYAIVFVLLSLFDVTAYKSLIGAIVAGCAAPALSLCGKGKCCGSEQAS